MKAGDTVKSPLFGEIVISAVFDTEDEAREAGYYYDAHVHDHKWQYKVLGRYGRFTAQPAQEFCACRAAGEE